MKINKKKRVIEIFSFLVLLMTIGFISAEFAIGAPNALVLLPGASQNTAVSIQNVLDGATDVVINAKISQGAEYATLTGNTDLIEVAAGAIVEVPITVIVPEDAKLEDIYTISILFESVSGGTSGDEGMIEFSYNVEKSFEVFVGERTSVTGEGEEVAPEGIGMVWIILGIILVLVVIIVIVFLVKNKKNVAPSKK